MCEITIDNFESKFQEISYTLQKANFVGKFSERFNFYFIIIEINKHNHSY